MIKGKKRAPEKSTQGDEPVKSKTPKLEVKAKVEKKKPAGEDGSAKSTKFSKPTKNIGAKPGAGKFTSKPGFKKPAAGGKFGNSKFSGKPGAAGGKFGNNKFAGKPGAAGGKFGNNKFAGKPGATGNDAAAATEKTDWRKFKQDKKDLKLKRKQSKDSYEVSIEAKQIYEKLKCRRTEKKNELVEKLYNLLSSGDLIKKVVMAHDTARIIQCMLKFASPSVREQISEKLLPLSVDMSISKYSHFCVLRMFKYGSPSIKSKLVDSFMGHVVKLACHNISSKILDHVYLTVASPKQKIYMRQEFYGDLYKKSKDDNVKVLADTYKEMPNMKASILGSVKSNLDHVANKQLVDNSLVHAVMLEYLQVCDEDKIEETVSMYANLIPLMLSTKDGSQAATICFYKSTPKNRRAIIKTIKEHLVKICTHEHGHIFILAVMNSLDDTKATKKAIYDTIHPELQTLMSNQWGRRVIEWLISPADTNSFHPTFIASIEDGLQYGKKDKDVRRKEIFEQIEEPIANAIADQPEFWISNRHIALVTAAILKKLSTVNFEKAANSLATIICDVSWTVTVEEDSSKDKKGKKSEDIEKVIEAATKLKKKKKLEASKEEKEDDASEDEEDKTEEMVVPVATIAGIEESGLHIVLKKIIKNDKDRLSQTTDGPTFGSIIIAHLTDETIKYWLTVNRGCFVLLNIVENNNESIVSTLKDLVKPHLSILKKQKGSGGQLLLKKLAI